jgi:peptidylprolyl isomerase
MIRAKLGDRVRVQYLGLLNDGSISEKHQGRQVLEFTVGSKEVMAGISFGVLGMAEGEQKRMTLQPKDAFGAVRPKLIREVARRHFPNHLNLSIGKNLTSVGVNSRRRRQVRVVDIKSDSVVVDGNHPLAGKTLRVEIQLISLKSAGADTRKGK